MVLSDRDAEKIKAELSRYRLSIAALADDAYRKQWLDIVDRLIAKLNDRRSPSDFIRALSNDDRAEPATPANTLYLAGVVGIEVLHFSAFHNLPWTLMAHLDRQGFEMTFSADQVL